ncbi:MAG: hypothetical protein Kow0090_11250 [Myxococcota bacterium]
MKFQRINKRSTKIKSLLCLFVALPLFLLFPACSTKYIPHTTIEDTPENRAIVRLMDEYRQAMEELNAQRLTELAAPDYYDTAGTPAPEDDINLAGLKEFLEKEFAKIKILRLTIRIERITPDKDNENIQYVDFRYVVRYQLTMPSGDIWKADEELKRITVIRQSESSPWLIQSGM